MPLYMDIHELPGITPEQLAQAHAADLQTQQKYGVEYQNYWVNHECGKVFCLLHAPNPHAAEQVHREAHGFLAEKILEVQPEVIEAFLGAGPCYFGTVRRDGSPRVHPVSPTAVAG